MGLKTVLKNNKNMYYFIKKIRNIQLVYLPYLGDRLKFILRKVARILYISRGNPYRKLKTLKNKHQNERCFIVATGPSLKIEDLEKLQNETTISMNSICLAFGKTDWRPTYYGIQDMDVYLRMKEHIEGLNVKGKFIADYVQKRYNFEILKDHYIFAINELHHFLPNNKNYNTKFSKNIYSQVYSGNTITYSLLQIAVYMGFKEIYLLGADCHYSKDLNHHFINYDSVDPDFAMAGEMMTAAYKTAKKYADKHNIKIYNATRGGKLEVFDRVDLDEVLAKNQLKTMAL